MHAYKEEEEFWRQKCRDKWAICGDRSTKFYHASVKANRAKKKSSETGRLSGGLSLLGVSQRGGCFKLLY